MPRISGLVSGHLSLAAVLALALAALGALGASGCASTVTTLSDDEEAVSSSPTSEGNEGKAKPAAPAPFASTYKPWPSGTTLIRNATVLTGTGERIDGGSVLIEGGQDRRGWPRRHGARRRRGGRRRRQVGDAGDHRRPLPPRRLPRARGRRPPGRQRGHRAR